MFAKEHFHDAQILAELITIKYKIRKCFWICFLDAEKYFD